MKGETQAEKEERTCTCGAGHGSLEGHTDWCEWLERRRKPRAALTSALAKQEDRGDG